MLTLEKLKDSTRPSGFKHVMHDHGGGFRPKPYRAQGRANRPGTLPRYEWRGPRRTTAVEAAQDYCDYINGLPAATPGTLKTAGHAQGLRAPLPRDEEVQHALGVLRDARAQRQGKQGYVYLIWEGKANGGLRYGKVGYSTNPEARVAELQTGNPRTLVLLYKKPGTPEDEAALHQKYMQNNVLQEWFYITKELILEFDAEHSVGNMPATMSRAS